MLHRKERSNNNQTQLFKVNVSLFPPLYERYSLTEQEETHGSDAMSMRNVHLRLALELESHLEATWLCSSTNKTSIDGVEHE